MDFMDDDMKEIANKAYIACGDEHDECVYAACEAVLAEQKRQKQAWDGYPPLEEAPPQMDATMADEVRQQPAEDVVQRMIDAYLGCKERSITAGTTWLRPSMAAALAVAREGMVPASELEELRRWKKEQMQVESEWDAQAVGRELDLPLGSSIRAGILPAVKKLRQQLSTMYSLEQTLDSLSYEEIKEIEQIFSDCAKTQINYVISARRARLTAKQQPTEQEPAKWVNISYHPDYMGSSAKMCGLCGALVSYEFAHTNWHNNLLAALGKGGK